MFKWFQNYLLNRVAYQEKITLTNKNIYILPTKAGFSFALILLLMLLTAINFSNSLIYLLTFFLVSMAIVSMLFTQKSLLNLSFQTGFGDPVFCKQSAMIPLTTTVSNRQQLFPAALTLKFNNFTQTIDIIKQHEAVTLPINTKTRGYVTIPPITVSTTFPFGLFYAWSTIKLSNQTLVYPQPVKTASFDQSGRSIENGGDKNQHRGMDDFSGLDKFIKGQSAKQVHWKAYAKQQGLYIKIFSGGSNSDRYWFDIDMFDSVIRFEQRLSYLTYLIIQAEKNGDSYGLKTSQHTIAINRGNSHKHHCLKVLALLREPVFSQ